MVGPNEQQLLAYRTSYIEAEASWRESVLLDQCMDQALRVVEKRGGDPAEIAAKILAFRRGEAE